MNHSTSSNDPANTPSRSAAEEPSVATESSNVASDNAAAAVARYQEQLESINARCDVLAAKDQLLGKIRVGLFLAAIVFWLLGYASNDVPSARWIGWIAFALFFVVATLNEPIRDAIAEMKRHRSVFERLIARLNRDWNALATKRLTSLLASVELHGHRREVAGDLDLLGRASLFHLVSMAATTPGIRTLAQWLSGPSIAETAAERAKAVDALAPMRDQRIRFYTLARDVGESTGDPEQFTRWATGDTWLQKRSWLSSWALISVVLTFVMLGALLLGGAGWLPAMAFRIGLVGLISLIVINLLITTLMLGPAHEIFSIAMANRRMVTDYEEIFSAATWLPVGDDDRGGVLSRIRNRMVDGDRCAVQGMRQLQRVAAAGGLRQSAGTFLLYLPLQAFGLWDVWVLKRLESWQSHFRDQVADWFEALGELEALMSIAALRDEYPTWARATWNQDPATATVKATAIGHPLLPDSARVRNDVQVGPPGTLLLVTGSNMSGKSTMLRSVGLNVALAGAGAPVCAQQFETASIELATSIRVSDDVSEGVSFYMAELKRLKSVVDQARQMAKINDRVCLFLLDEILQGTNSRERQIAVVQVLRHLMDSRSIGAITTHDLELADEPELQSIATTVHFRETIRPDAKGNEQMTFDYQMRQGVSPTTNALRLLEMVGLGDHTPED
ncbi:DNA mismatch repair protein MutS [Rubripirellula lacrimiformis]|uniref:DNA mismatch repair protein MutS n=1 Tax=Rubripirellula lacrimiformis TaxID=1930273 RepID=A0A517NKM2_9BACT|nr:MutS family DNA mismatch repair protein [Rubripirellula lacrimiformis]QDT07676.1 DNA mismatch repair protein MutS [Rubripirellula lacrimiformis]